MAITLKQLQVGMVINALFGYHVGTVVVGLLAHPYKTVQNIVRKSIPSSSIFFPLVCWIVGMLLLRALEHYMWFVVPSLGLWWFLFVWGTTFLLFWQILLVYLFLRFSSVLTSSRE